MRKYSFDSLLDIDELTESQQRYLESLITYDIKVAKNGYYNLIFKIKKHKDPSGLFGYCYTLKEPKLDQNAYKHIMYYLIEWKAIHLKDSVAVNEIKELLTKPADIRSDNDVKKHIILEGKDFIISHELNIRSQDLFKVLEIINKDSFKINLERIKKNAK